MSGYLIFVLFIHLVMITIPTLGLALGLETDEISFKEGRLAWLAVWLG